MNYNHSRDFLKKKLRKLNKQINKLQQERLKVEKQYYKSFDKEELEFLNVEFLKREEEERYK